MHDDVEALFSGPDAVITPGLHLSMNDFAGVIINTMQSSLEKFDDLTNEISKDSIGIITLERLIKFLEFPIMKCTAPLNKTSDLDNYVKAAQIIVKETLVGKGSSFSVDHDNDPKTEEIMSGNITMFPDAKRILSSIQIPNYDRTPDGSVRPRITQVLSYFTQLNESISKSLSLNQPIDMSNFLDKVLNRDTVLNPKCYDVGHSFSRDKVPDIDKVCCSGNYTSIFNSKFTGQNYVCIPKGENSIVDAVKASLQLSKGPTGVTPVTPITRPTPTTR
jgi:hypothetical protein